MSLEVAKTWANRVLRPPAAADDAVGMFEQAVELGVQATLLAAAELTANGKPCLARWTGTELVVLYLNAPQAENFRIRPGTLLRTIEAHTSGVETVGDPLLALCDVRLDGPDPHDGVQPLKGRYRLTSDDSNASYILSESAALRSHFFHPDMRGGITCYSYIEASLLPPDCELTFSFDPLFRPQAPPPPRGTWVLFLQLVRPHVWGRPNEGCTAASNVAAAIVDIQ